MQLHKMVEQKNAVLMSSPMHAASEVAHSVSTDKAELQWRRFDDGIDTWYVQDGTGATEWNLPPGAKVI